MIFDREKEEKWARLVGNSIELFESVPGLSWAALAESSFSGKGREDAPLARLLLTERTEWAKNKELLFSAGQMRATVLSEMLEELRDDLLCPFLTAVGKESAKDLMSDYVESVLVKTKLAKRDEEKKALQRILEKLLELDVIAKTPKRANLALVAGEIALSLAIRKPSPAALKELLVDFRKELKPETFAPYAEALPKMAEKAVTEEKRRILKSIFRDGFLFLVVSEMNREVSSVLLKTGFETTWLASEMVSENGKWPDLLKMLMEKGLRDEAERLASLAREMNRNEWNARRPTIHDNKWLAQDLERKAPTAARTTVPEYFGLLGNRDGVELCKKMGWWNVSLDSLREMASCVKAAMPESGLSQKMEAGLALLEAEELRSAASSTEPKAAKNKRI